MNNYPTLLGTFTVRFDGDEEEDQFFVSNLARGPSGKLFHFGNFHPTLANDVGQVVRASLEQITRGGVCVFIRTHSMMEQFYQYWSKEQFFGGVSIFRQPKGDRWTAGEQFDDQLEKFNSESHIGKAVLLTYYRGKMNVLAERTYGCSKVVVFAGMQYIPRGDRSDAVQTLNQTITKCLTYAPDNNRALVMLEPGIISDLRQLPGEARRATLENFVDFKHKLKTFCYRHQM